VSGIPAGYPEGAGTVGRASPAGQAAQRVSIADSAAAWEAAGGWRTALPELVIAAILVLVLAAAAFAFAGTGAAAVIMIIAAGSALIALRGLVRPDQPVPASDDTGHRATPPASFTGFWRKRAELADGVASMSAYEMHLRGTLQHLLAARLAERHGVSLYQDPESARQLLCPGDRDDRLWYWIDPARPPAPDDGTRPGIPPRTLATLIDRLERL
jgi:hypothetical protein